MWLSLLRRITHALLLLGVISVLAFGLSKMVPGDEVLDYLSIDDTRYSSSADPLHHRQAYSQVASKRGLDLPLFYFSVIPGYYPDSLYNIVPAEDRQTLKKWIRHSRNEKASRRLYATILDGLTYACPKASVDPLAMDYCYGLSSLLKIHDLNLVKRNFMDLHSTLNLSSHPDSAYLILDTRANSEIHVLTLGRTSLPPLDWLPSIHWHGVQNQYHQWMIGFVMFRPLTSLIDGRDAWSKIIEALKWTLWLNGLAFLLAILLGVLIGIWSGIRDGSVMERVMHILLFGLFAVPSFWLATLLIYFLSSGEWWSVFPAGGLGPYHTAGNIIARWGILLTHLTLPVLCLALGALAYVSRQMKQSVMHQMDQPYVHALRALGISEKTILRKHVIRNALFPLITLIGGALPALLSGSLIIEVIFSIPGMGRLMYTSLLARDWPVVFPVLMLGATITVLSYIVTDVVYKWADPRVKSLGP